MRPSLAKWVAGDHKTMATFVAATAEIVTLAKPDGSEIAVPMSRLTEESQAKAMNRAARPSVRLGCRKMEE